MIPVLFSNGKPSNDHPASVTVCGLIGFALWLVWVNII